MPIFACVTLAAVLTGARNITEMNDPGENSLSFCGAMSVVLKNRRLTFLYLMIMCEHMGGVIKNQVAIYYMKYYINKPDAIPLFLLVGILGSLLAQPLVLMASKRFRCSHVMIGGYLMAAASISIVWFSDRSLPLLMAANALFGLFSAFPANLVYVYAVELAEALSYGGNGSFYSITNSLLGIYSKLAYTIGGSAVALVLYLTSYVPNAVQNEPTLRGIRSCFITLTAAVMLSGAAFAFASFHGTSESETAARAANDEDAAAHNV
jgi:GPH family glycoside/pentoside/hexuronide:cation symporter